MNETLRANYGIDAPGLVRGFLFSGIGLLAAGGIAVAFRNGRTWLVWFSFVLFVLAIYAVGMCCLMLWGSLVDKVRGREFILDLVQWKGDEAVLDIGCGRGLMLIGAARRLTVGIATGVDIWAAKDQSSNTKSGAEENARIEGVVGRVEIKTADMRDLPFEAHSFDVILSSWAVHNLEDKSDRVKAISEMVRVLRPGGAILLTDIVNRDEYAASFQQLGMTDIQVVVFSSVKDWLLRAVSFGSFQPATVVAR